ncbi:lytic transglycosylase domain-containing protein [Stappia indica]|uniref:lytic transglycosylase domain-containing protein n=1 Tax=Stappia indica TaxID=538381 RepID=UPI000831847C
MVAPHNPAGVGRSSTIRRSALFFFLSGLALIAAATPPVMAQAAPPVGAASVDPHAVHITEASQRFGIPEAWIVAVIQAESAGDVHAVSSVGAMGLMQVMPDTWAELRTRYDLGRDPYEPRNNILAGTAYLREIWERYGDVAAMLAAYNAGPARYDEHRSTGHPLPAETRAYVALLAPQLGVGSRSPHPATTPPRQTDWRDAPLFVVRSGDSHTANLRADGGALGDRRSPVPANGIDAVGMEAASIFLAGDGSGSRQ